MANSEKKDSENRRGARDASKGRMRHEPWAGPFEPHKDYDERCDAYNAGYDNAVRQKDENKGSCFLTTACVEFAGLLPDCRELKVMRKFRDAYVSSRPDGEKILREYYSTAPALLQNIQRSPDREAIFSESLDKIRKAIDHIEAGRSLEAFEVYANVYSKLLQQFRPTNRTKRRTVALHETTDLSTAPTDPTTGSDDSDKEERAL